MPGLPFKFGIGHEGAHVNPFQVPLGRWRVSSACSSPNKNPRGQPVRSGSAPAGAPAATLGCGQDGPRPGQTAATRARCERPHTPAPRVRARREPRRPRPARCRASGDRGEACAGGYGRGMSQAARPTPAPSRTEQPPNPRASTADDPTHCHPRRTRRAHAVQKRLGLHCDPKR